MTKVEALKNEMKGMRDLQDITNVMEQVAAQDIARMREEILGSRQFFKEVWRVYRVLKQLSPPPPEIIHKHLIVAVGADQGMSGSLLSKVLDKVALLQKEHNADLALAGKKTHYRFKDYDGCTVHFFSVPKGSTLAGIQPIYKVVAEYARVTFVYPRFDSLSQQTVVTSSFSSGTEKKDEEAGDDANELASIQADRFIIDPNPQVVSNYLNEAVVGITVYHYFAEAMLAYSAAQMIAMRNGYDNAKEANKTLRSQYNSAKRAMIDTKLRELYGMRGGGE